jgi:aerobic carbon-monoxide dehydrogenase large subunit
MPDALIGAPVRRKEDRRFITGAGHFTDDIKLPGLACGSVLRSPHAAARVRSVDTAAATRMPGVLCVLTGRDAEADGLGGLPVGWQTYNRDGSKMAEPPHPVLASARVRHVGDPVAFVVAETLAQAEEAAAAIRVDYEPLLAVTELPRALDPSAPQVWDEVPGNLCYDWEVGDESAVEAAFAAAHRVVSLDLVQNRINACPMEPRACIGQYDAGTESFVLHTSSQNPHIIRVLLSAFTLKVPEERVRVISPDVGGGFGMKIYHYAEEVLVTWAARRIGRPVKWTATRSESFQCDTYARDHATTVKLALDAEGHFIGLRVDTIANMGGYLSTFAPAIPTFFYANPLPGPYTTKAVYARVRAAFTNTVPVDAYRGAGRPEATFLLERIVDLAARESGIDAVEIRRRNLIPADAFPYQSPLLWEYDTGDFLRCLDATMQAADRNGFAARRAQSGRKGLLRGQGIAFYMEACGMGPSKMLGQHGCRAGQYEVATVRVNPTGGVTVLTGSHTHGQGHETVFSQIVADRLGLPLEKIDIVHGDTGRVPYGLGSYGSRSLAVGGSALHLAIEKVIAKA